MGLSNNTVNTLLMVACGITDATGVQPTFLMKHNLGWHLPQRRGMVTCNRQSKTVGLTIPYTGPSTLEYALRGLCDKWGYVLKIERERDP